MKKLLMFTAPFIILIYSGCDVLNSDADPTPYGNLKVSGVVVMQDSPISGATVQIDDINNWRVQSGENGRFEIFRVAGGDHELKIEKALEDGRVVGQRTRVFLSEQAQDLGTFLLPIPSGMMPIDQSLVTSNSIQLKWERTNDPDFVEYRIYRSTSPELSDLSGELIYTTKSIDEVEYIDANFRTGVQVYYRIYVVSTFGRYAGSKVESASAPALNLVSNPGFEESSSGILPDFWVERIAGTPEFKFFQVSSDDKKIGQRSSKITYIESQANPHPERGSWGGIYQHVFTDNMNYNETYRFTFWLKMISGSVQMRLMKNGDFSQPLLYAELPSTNEWQEHSIEFKIDQDTRFIEIWMNTKAELANGGIVHGFIDELSIIK